jgi:uncharacterized membrane protein
VVKIGRKWSASRMDLYELIKYVHVVSAITAVGFNLSYGVWLSRNARAPEHQVHVLRTIKLLDDRIANPAYVLLLLTGLGMVWVGNIPITTAWIVVSLLLYGALVVIGLGVFTPALRRQIDLAESGASAPDSAAAARRTTISGGVLVLVALVIVFLMVTKPAL